MLNVGNIIIMDNVVVEVKDQARPKVHPKADYRCRHSWCARPLSLAVMRVTIPLLRPGVVTFHRRLAPCIHAIATSTNRTIVHVPI